MSEDPAECFGKRFKWDKLSNSGDILKLLVPSHSRKAMSGWTNHPCTVISQEMTENEMGYRGSKSVFLNSTVKEQRVDGSYCIKAKSNLMQLRCTLMGFERNYQVKVLSKQLNKTNFCTSAYAQVQQSNLDPWFVTGFCDGEASFSVSIYKDKRIKGRVGWAVKPSFQISLHSKDISLLEQLQIFFGCGLIVKKNKRSEISLRVNSIQNLKNLYD